MALRFLPATFKHQLILIIVVSTLLPAIVLAGILLFQIKQHAETTAIDAVNKQLEQGSETIKYTVSIMDSELQQFALDQNNILAAENSVFSVYARERMFTLLSRHPEVNLLQIYDTQQWPTESAPTEFEFFGLDNLFNEIPQLIPQGKTPAYQLFNHTWLRQEYNQKSQNYKHTSLFYSISVPLYKQNENDPNLPIKTGFVIAILSFDKLLESTEDYSYSLSASPITPVTISQGKDTTVLVNELDLNGEPLFLALQIDTYKLEEPIWRAIKTIYIIVSFIIISALIAAFYFSRRLSRPFTEMESIIRNYHNRKFYQTKPDLGYSEFDRLYEVLTEMAHTIDKKQHLLTANVKEKQAIFNTMLDGLIIINERGIIQDINEATESLFGYERDELIGQNVKQLMEQGEADKHDNYIATHINTGLSKVIGIGRELKAKKKSGLIFHAYLSIAKYEEDGKVRFVGTIRDISHHVKERLDLKFDAQHDELTKLPTRRLLEQKIEAAISESKGTGKHFYLLFLDLNKFKPINDKYGHGVGDEVLKVIAKRLKHALRGSDFCARVGGDEFIILCEPNASSNEIEIITDKLIEIICKPIQINELLLTIDASIGYAHFPNDGDSQQALMSIADKRMYLQKKGC